MKAQLAAMVLVCLLASVGHSQEDAVKIEQKKLNGTWAMESLEMDGKKLDSRGKSKWVISGEKLTKHLIEDDFRFFYSIKIHPGKQPKWIDFSSQGPDGKKMTMTGIYSLEGDTLKICVSGIQDRPKEFVANKEYTVITLKRAAP